jgi:hypothetical protein
MEFAGGMKQIESDLRALAASENAEAGMPDQAHPPAAAVTVKE